MQTPPERCGMQLDFQQPTRLFFRDDDGGWADERLQALCDLFLELGAPLDIAVIPAAVTANTRKVINRARERRPDLIHVHQHGCRHVNHESTGRKCEFGRSRSQAEQARDIEWGRRRMHSHFGTACTPAFTPPWNRCTATTMSLLESLGYRAVSRISGSEPLPSSRVAQVDVTVDWLKQRDGRRLMGPAFAAYVAKRLRGATTVGFMLHHEHMDSREMTKLRVLLERVIDDARISFDTLLGIARRHEHA